MTFPLWWMLRQGASLVETHPIRKAKQLLVAGGDQEVAEDGEPSHGHPGRPRPPHASDGHRFVELKHFTNRNR